MAARLRAPAEVLGLAEPDVRGPLRLAAEAGQRLDPDHRAGGEVGDGLEHDPEAARGERLVDARVSTLLVGGRPALLGEVVVDRRLERRVVQLEAAVERQVSSRLATRSSTSVRSNGLVRKSLAPASRARSRTSALASAVSTRTGRNPSSGTISCRESMTAKPSRCGMCRSSRTRSGSDSAQKATASRGSVDPWTRVIPARSSNRVSSVTLAAVSSTTTTVDVTSTPFMLGICAVAADMSGRVRRSPKVIARPSSRRGDGAPRARRSAS